MRKEYLYRQPSHRNFHGFTFAFLLLTFSFQLFTLISFSQGVGINSTGGVPDAKAMLDIDVSSMNPKRGLLVPRMTTTERNAITAPIPESLLIYNLTTQCFEAYNPTISQWVSFGCIGGCQFPTTFSANAATGISATSFSANWTGSSGATNYFLDVATDAGFTTFVSGYNNLNVGNVITQNITGLTCNTTYYYRLRASNTCGTTANSGTITCITIGCVACGGPYTYNDVTNPATGKIWLDRNLGASQVATSATDYLAFGSLFQWGRLADGHECIFWTSSSAGTPVNDTTYTLSTTDIPSTPKFILWAPPSSTADWRNPPNDNLWQGVIGINNPCPSGYRIPTMAEWNAETATWSSPDAAGAFASPLKLTLNGLRGFSGIVTNRGQYWSSTVVTTWADGLEFTNSSLLTVGWTRTSGQAVRCIKN